MNNFMRKGLLTTVATLVTVGVMAFGLSRDTAKEIVYNFKNNHPNKVTDRTAKGTHKLNTNAAKFAERVSEIFIAKPKQATTLEGGNDDTPEDAIKLEQKIIEKGLIKGEVEKVETIRNEDDKIISQRFYMSDGNVLTISAMDARLQEEEQASQDGQTPQDSVNKARATVSGNEFDFDSEGNILYPDDTDKNLKNLYDDYNTNVPSHAKMDFMHLQKKLQAKGLPNKEVRMYMLDAFSMMAYSYNLTKRFRIGENGTIATGSIGGPEEEIFIRYDFVSNNSYDADFLTFMRRYNDENNLPTASVFSNDNTDNNTVTSAATTVNNISDLAKKEAAKEDAKKKLAADPDARIYTYANMTKEQWESLSQEDKDLMTRMVESSMKAKAELQAKIEQLEKSIARGEKLDAKGKQLDKELAEAKAQLKALQNK